MALVNNRKQRITMLCAMYVAQGIPWGFMATALITYLTSRGVGDEEAGELSAIILLPWTFKLIWAPLIDTMTIRSMGRRRPWIIVAELLMAVSLLGLLTLGDLTKDLRLLGWMFFVHNCFASLQDVATDALAVDVLPIREQGRANGLMWGSKLVGRGFGTAVMAQVMAHWGLREAVLLQFIVLMIIMLWPLLLVERPGEKRFPWSDGEAQDVESASGVRSPLRVLKDLYRGFSLITTSVFFVFGTISMIGWGIVEVITKTLYTQRLNWTFIEYSNVATCAIVAELIGAVVGGYLADRFGRRLIMTVGFSCYGLLAIAFGAFPGLWHERWFTTGYLFLNPGALAVGSVGFLSASMRLSWTKSSATMFTVFMTVSNIGHVIGNRVVGPLREHCSYEESFWVVGLVMILPLILLTVVNLQQVDDLRKAER